MTQQNGGEDEPVSAVAISGKEKAGAAIPDGAGTAPHAIGGGDKPASAEDQQKEIEAIADSAQLAWFSLLGFLAFYSLVMLTTTDADFFSSAKQTQLPIVNITISSQVFYFAAPIVATILYVYLHFLCLILWRRAQGTPEQILQNSLSTSLIGTVVLALKPKARPRGLDQSQWVIAFFGGTLAGVLIWLAHPLVLFLSDRVSNASPNFFTGGSTESASSDIATHFTVTLVCMGLSGLMGAISFWNALGIRRPEQQGPMGLKALCQQVAFRLYTGLALAAFLLIMLAGGLGIWGILWNKPTIDIERRPLAQTPAGWISADARRETYRRDWCKEEKTPLAICAQRPRDAAERRALADGRAAFCATTEPGAEGCEARLAERDRAFAADFRRVRKAELESVPELDLSGWNVPGMKAERVRLVNARLEAAHLEGAKLSWANLEGAVLIDARLNDATAQDAAFDNADLTRVHLEGAQLPSSSLFNAALLGADLDGATLKNAGLEYADLTPAGGTDTEIPRRASLKKADLTDATLRGADLSGADLDGTILAGADLSGARLDGAVLDADLSGATGLVQAQLDLAVGGAATKLPAAKPPLHILTCWPQPTQEQEVLIKERKTLIAVQVSAIETLKKKKPFEEYPDPTLDRPLECGKPGSPTFAELEGPLLPEAPPAIASTAGPSTPVAGAPDLAGPLGEIRDRLDAGNGTLNRLALAVEGLRAREACNRTLACTSSGDQQPATDKADAQTTNPPATGELARLNFDVGAYKLTDGAQKLAEATIPRILTAPDGTVRVEGYADRRGSTARNQILADARARSVADFLIAKLIARGVPQTRIEYKGHGESDGPVPTEDGVSEPLNRTAVIFLHAGPDTSTLAKNTMMQELSPSLASSVPATQR